MCAKTASLLSHIARPSGLLDLAHFLDKTENTLSADDQAQLHAFIRKEISDVPRLRDVQIAQVDSDRPVGFYNPRSNTITTNTKASIPVMAHELEHAKRLGQNSVYRKLVDISSQLTGFNEQVVRPAAEGAEVATKKKFLPYMSGLAKLTIPASIGAALLLKDNPVLRNKVLGAMAAATAVAAVPRIYEEVQATRHALNYVPDKMEAVKTLAPGAIAYSIYGAQAPLLALLVKALANKLSP
jgi:hypothetical protein